MVEIELLFMDFQEKLMTLNAQGVIELAYEFGEPVMGSALEESSIKVFRELKLPSAFQHLYFSNGFEMLWKSKENEVTGYWNLIKIQYLKEVKQAFIENSPVEENQLFLEKFQPVFYHSPEIVLGFLYSDDELSLWTYSENSFEKREILLTPVDYIKLVMDCMCVENLSAFMFNIEAFPKTQVFIKDHSNKDFLEITQTIKQGIKAI